ncbi:hypothetical protein V7122_08225, partial [Bacillus sp. JJ1532]|uniref:hypothetical protein n=1 Tax=Bacillus sp. JJ1532 TaxID=3122958 RepID=UPI002FFEE625
LPRSVIIRSIWCPLKVKIAMIGQQSLHLVPAEGENYYDQSSVTSSAARRSGKLPRSVNSRII